MVGGAGGKVEDAVDGNMPQEPTFHKRNVTVNLFLSGLFLSSNIFIQIPVKTTSDTGYATMV